MLKRPALPLLLLYLGCLGACSTDKPAPPAAPSASAPASPASAPAAAAPAPLAPTLQGSAVVRAAGEEALYIADEDAGVLRKVALPVDVHAPPLTIKVPGPPAAVLALRSAVLVTIRGVANGDAPPTSPGLLLIMQPDKTAGLVETARVELPADAWGLAVTPDQKTALVTSAWTHKVSAVDIASRKKLWTLDVPREPRGVAVRPDGKSAYVTHLVSSTLTRIDGLDGEAKAHAVAFPAAPLRTIAERAEAATLGYAPVLSPDGSRLFVARQALGAAGKRAWNGQATVDILLTADDTPLGQRPSRWFIMLTAGFMKDFNAAFMSRKDETSTGPGPTQREAPFIQPRAALYRKKTRTLLIASEGTDSLVELEALSIDPSTHVLQRYPVGGVYDRDTPGSTHCGAPSGVALSADEATAFVFCRTTHDLAVVPLLSYDAKVTEKEPLIPILHLGDDPLPEKEALGRRFFYNAWDGNVSGYYACAGCHPEGRDDGHVWHEIEEPTGKESSLPGRLMSYEMNTMFGEFDKGAPRQTPMLAGRVSAPGPYGWKGRSATLRHRLLFGLSLHRWGDEPRLDATHTIAAAEALAAFLPKGLVPPPREEHDLTAEEQRGRQVFSDPNVGCAECHVPKSEYTNRSVVGLGEWPLREAHFDKELNDWRFKTPSLLYIAGTPPYFHDGSAPTLEALIEQNGTRMGHTKQLSPEDRGALVAFLKTL